MITKIRKYADKHWRLPLDPDAVWPGHYGKSVHTTPSLIGAVFVGGVVGTALRYGLCELAPTSVGLPVGTLTVNIIGSFLIGLLIQSLSNRGPDHGVRRIYRLLLGVGLIGAFTTYSSFAVEVAQLVQRGNLTLAIGYILITLLGGLAFTALGIFIAGRIHRRISA